MSVERDADGNKKSRPIRAALEGVSKLFLAAVREESSNCTESAEDARAWFGSHFDKDIIEQAEFKSPNIGIRRNSGIDIALDQFNVIPA